jgi:DNA repair exonuclease SbcCD ATPase subunit
MEQDRALHIVELRAENVKRLQAVTIRPDGNMVIIGGRNAQGKTSLLDAIEMALGGGKTIPAEPVKRGARKARIVADLGEIVVERTFTPKGTTVEVRNKEGVPQKSPQALLDSLCAKVAFDPLSFAREEAKKQDAILKQVLGLDFSELDNSRAALFERRREVKRDAKALEARLDAAVEHAGVPGQEVSVAELTEQLERLRDEMDENRNRRLQFEAANDARSETLVDIAAAETRIQELEQALAEEQESLHKLHQQREEEEARANALAAQVAALVDPDPTPIKEQIANAEATNRKVRANKERRELAGQLSKLESKVDELTSSIEAIDAKKQAQLEAAQFPVPGLGFDDLGPTLHGIALSQSSQAERLRVSVAIGAALNPRVKVMLIRDASLLDDEAMEVLAKFAHENDCQLWLERVGNRDESAIIIEDGMVQAEEAAQ